MIFSPFWLQVQSEVASLDIYTCDGQNHIVIKDLSPSNSVEIILPHTNIVRITAQRFIPTILRVMIYFSAKQLLLFFFLAGFYFVLMFVLLLTETVSFF